MLDGHGNDVFGDFTLWVQREYFPDIGEEESPWLCSVRQGDNSVVNFAVSSECPERDVYEVARVAAEKYALDLLQDAKSIKIGWRVEDHA